jgi:hypothetical protein
MLSHCANSQCSKLFLRLREGKLFVVKMERSKNGAPESPPFARARQAQQRLERCWLCDPCAAVWTLVYNQELGIRLAPLPGPAGSVPAAIPKWSIA